jgi:NTP pyrophosphatase (non-canonical NTP hydrolase)
VNAFDGDLPQFARTVTPLIHQTWPTDDGPLWQVLKVVEEAGEFVKAYRKWAGKARATGPWEDVEAELADVVLAAYTTAEELGIDLDAAWRAKAGLILTRGWRDAPAEDAAVSR